MASTLATQLGHLKNHVKYPADKKALVAACNNLQDSSPEDRTWFVNNIPEGKYNTPADVINALLKKV